jgi:hypothetical protein
VTAKSSMYFLDVDIALVLSCRIFIAAMLSRGEIADIIAMKANVLSMFTAEYWVYYIDTLLAVLT